MSYHERTALLQQHLSATQLCILSRSADIEYYTGFICLTPEEREAFVILSADSATLLYPSFSPVKKVAGIRYHTGPWPSDLQEVVEEYVKKLTLDNSETNIEIFLDKASLFLNEFEAIHEVNAEFTELDRSVIWHQRMPKDPEELQLLQKAGKITAQTMKFVQSKLDVGITEREVAGLVEARVRELGAQSCSFPPVVAFGDHSALPHHQPTSRKLTKNMVVLIDIGAKYNGYCGDMTRTVWFGDTPTKKFQEIEEIVKDAYEAAVKECYAGISGAVVDTAARQVIEKQGYGKQYIHTTGHGVGLEIHEQPSLYYKKELVLPENAVVTIEPGIYLKGEFGYRYENMVAVRKNAATALT